MLHSSPQETSTRKGASGRKPGLCVAPRGATHKGLTKLLRRVGLSIKLISADPSKKHSTQSVTRVLCVDPRGATRKELAFREGLLRVDFLRTALALDSRSREVKAVHAEMLLAQFWATNGRAQKRTRGHCNYL